MIPPWKDLLDRLQRLFLEFFFPRIAADIDWSRGFAFLDKELQKVTRRAVVGRRYVDKLLEVWRLGGEETRVLIHTEVQGEPDPGFARRLYTYHPKKSSYTLPHVTQAAEISAQGGPHEQPDRSPAG
jgi:hypothetical protein